MLSQLKNYFKRRGRRKNQEIYPDEIFLDSQNLPDFDTHQFEGRMEKPISNNIFRTVSFFIVIIGLIFTYKLWELQVVSGESLRTRSESNSLQKTLIYADRGVIYDRNGTALVWNTINPEVADYSLRVYASSTGLSTILGYVKYPTKDSSGKYYQEKFDPKDGIEKIYNDKISGRDGTRIVETNVKGNIISESVVEQPIDGENITLSIDSKLQKKLRDSLLDIANRAGYHGGAGIIMDVHTGEILASSNFPEYDSAVMTDGSNKEKIEGWLNSSNHPFLNRVVSGLYTPGSIMKIFFAIGVLDQGVIDPNKQILSTGSISIPNPFFPEKPSVFMDWKAHGLVDLRQAIAVSSNVYFYEVSGGYKDQKGIGIANLDKYSRMFGFGSSTGVDFPGEKEGTIPNPEWKEATFNGEAWRVGDTYNTAIGQYGFQVTPLQAVRAVAAIANEGVLLTPTFIKTDGQIQSNTLNNKSINIDPNLYKVVKEGMRLGVTSGTSAPLNFSFVKIASKTGTAQINIQKDEVNSWVVGFWPYENPKYAYAVVMERGSRGNQFSATLVMQSFFDWVHIYAPEYLE